MDKNEIRDLMQNRRNELEESVIIQKSKMICERIYKSSMYQSAKNICVYQAFRGEVRCNPLMERAFIDKKNVYVPVTDVLNKTITFCRIDENTLWHKGAYGILEPDVDYNFELNEGALICMPGLAFDRRKHRVGYGGGYYDRYLAAHKDHITMAMCYEFQILEEELPYESHDWVPDYIVTENNIII